LLSGNLSWSAIFLQHCLQVCLLFNVSSDQLEIDFENFSGFVKLLSISFNNLS